METTAAQVEERLRLGEDSHNEFKSVLHRLPTAAEIAEDVVAFANAGGGRIWFGVEDVRPGEGPHVVTGVPDVGSADALLRTAAHACRDGVNPPVHCEHAKVECEGRIVVVTSVPAFAPQRPYMTSKGVLLVRDGTQKRPATSDEIRTLAVSAAAGAVLPDEVPVPGTSETDLDAEHLDAYHRRRFVEPLPDAGPERTQLLRNLKVVGPSGELSLMGLLCFGRARTRLPWARVIAAREPGTELGASETLDRKDFDGPLDRQIRETVEFVLLHVPSPSRIAGVESETPEPALPPEVVREAVCNAVAHRDYAVASQVLVHVFADRVQIVSPGRLLNTVTIEQMRTGAVHVERNPLVASVLAGWGLMTERGTGIHRMRKLMAEKGLPEPEFALQGAALSVTLRWATAS